MNWNELKLFLDRIDEGKSCILDCNNDIVVQLHMKQFILSFEWRQ